ncbi:MAG: flagellar basal body protein, partial [Planctomycetes bacterium]|nr:flagellar basal body protein [Planctomycetota bacterium]
MGFCNALSTAVSGLASHQKALDNLGNNLANINTTGYKKGVYQFATMLEQTVRGGMSATGDRGSINPISMGLRTQHGSINQEYKHGPLASTT